MATAVIMPELGESVEEATITAWLKSEGDTIEEFEPLLEVNTDKVDTEIPSPASGTLLKILAGPDQVVQAGSTLAWIGSPGEEVPDRDGAAAMVRESAPAEAAPALEEPSIQSAPAPEVPANAGRVSLKIRPGRHEGIGYISPLVARMASEHNLDLSQIKGTGAEGRITKFDVQAYLEARPAAEQARPDRVPAPPAVPGEFVKLSPIRRSIADHMVMSKHTSPHVTTVMEADMSKVVAHRTEHKPVFARDGANLTYTAYLISAIVTALKAHPMVNASWSEDGIRLHREINVGMAVAMEPEGLIVPVIKRADTLSLLGLAQKVNDLAERARSRKLLPEEVRDGTFTLTNHGTSGSLFATPIINQPQCGILGAGMLEKRVVVINDAIAIRPMIYLSLTFDHRILDGATADYFLGKVKQTLENWSGE